MKTQYPETIHITREMNEKIDTPMDPAIISTRPGGSNTTQSFIKGDIVADNLNKVFGPLGWGSKAPIKEIMRWTEKKIINKNNNKIEVTMHMVQVLSEVELTIKKVTENGTDTVYVQPGVGYGEVEEGKSQKEAFGMAVKGAATDGLKRCASLIGKSFGMMLASNGSQEDIEYAHNGKSAALKNARSIRAAARNNNRSGNDSSGNRDQTSRDEIQNRQDDRPRNERQGNNSSNRQRENYQEDRYDEFSDERNNVEQRNTEKGGVQSESSSRGKVVEEQLNNGANERGAETQKIDPAKSEGPKKPGRKPVDKNYNLDNLPITSQDMTDFGATLIQRVNELRQQTDRVGLVRQHLNTIRNLDTKIRIRIIERLREINIDVDQISA